VSWSTVPSSTVYTEATYSSVERVSDDSPVSELLARRGISALSVGCLSNLKLEFSDDDDVYMSPPVADLRQSLQNMTSVFLPRPKISFPPTESGQHIQRQRELLLSFDGVTTQSQERLAWALQNPYWQFILRYPEVAGDVLDKFSESYSSDGDGDWTENWTEIGESNVSDDAQNSSRRAGQLGSEGVDGEANILDGRHLSSFDEWSASDAIDQTSRRRTDEFGNPTDYMHRRRRTSRPTPAPYQGRRRVDSRRRGPSDGTLSPQSTRRRRPSSSPRRRRPSSSPRRRRPSSSRRRRLSRKPCFNVNSAARRKKPCFGMAVSEEEFSFSLNIPYKKGGKMQQFAVSLSLEFPGGKLKALSLSAEGADVPIGCISGICAFASGGGDIIISNDVADAPLDMSVWVQPKIGTVGKPLVAGPTFKFGMNFADVNGDNQLDLIKVYQETSVKMSLSDLLGDYRLFKALNGDLEVSGSATVTHSFEPQASRWKGVNYKKWEYTLQFAYTFKVTVPGWQECCSSLFGHILCLRCWGKINLLNVDTDIQLASLPIGF